MISEKRKEELCDSADRMLTAMTPTAQCRVETHEEAMFLLLRLSDHGKVSIEPQQTYYRVVFVTRFSAAI